MKCSVYIATSLDGFIARPDGDIDWLSGGSSDSESASDAGGDYGYSAFMDSVDALVMGRNTFEKVLTFGDWPYGEKPVVVLSRTPIIFPDSIPSTVEASTLAPLELVEAFGKRGMRHLYIDGGRVVQSFLAANLIDEITVSIIPVLIGSGIPLFGPIEKDLTLVHVETTAFKSGLVQNKYKIDRGPK